MSILAFACDKEEDKTTYPGVFAELESTHELFASCAEAQVYAKLSDTSAILFNLRDGELGIGYGGDELTVADLTGWNGVDYYEWSTHPDSLTPNFCDDIAYENQSTIRKWELTSGTITAAVSKLEADREFMEVYKISIRLESGVFDRSESDLPNITIGDLIIRDAHVGWLPG